MPVSIDTDALLSVDPGRIYTDEEAGMLFKVPKRKVRVLINGGHLRGFKIGNTYRVQGQAILEFARGGGVPGSVYTPRDTMRRRAPRPRKSGNT